MNNKIIILIPVVFLAALCWSLVYSNKLAQDAIRAEKIASGYEWVEGECYPIYMAERRFGFDRPAEGTTGYNTYQSGETCVDGYWRKIKTKD